MTSEKYRDCKAFQSHELFPLLKLLADSHDRIPGQDHPEVMHNEMESLLRLELGKYDILDEMSNLLDNCRTLLDLHKQCHRRMQQQICHIQKDFLEQSSAIINSVKPLQQAPVYQPRGYDAMPGTVETGGSVLVGKRSADSLENRPSQLQLHPRADNASSSNVLPAKRRICASHILDGRQRAEVTHDESADDTSVSRYEERSPPDGEQALISPGFDNEQGRMKPTFRHPPTVTSYLKEWFSKHKENPYPTAQEKEMLIAKSEKKFGFTMTNQQLDNWFINQRRRVPNGPNRSRLGSVGQSAAESVTVTAGTAVSSTSTMQIGNPQSQLSSHTRTPIQSPTMPNNTALSPVQLQMVMSQQHWDSGHGTSTLGPASILKSPTTLTGAPIIFTTTKPGVAKSSVAIAAPQQVLLLTPAPQPASTQPAVLSALSPPSLLPPVSGITVVSPPAIPMATSPLHMVSPSAGTYASTQNPMPEVKRVAYPQPIHHQGYQGATTLVYQVSDNNPNAKLNARHKPTA
ncbi:homeobox protein Meis2-like isoform X2 [Sycon ciliatum]|uniref:homeobox protein Meis2-like isoform X2 n=1 Tax=Sycon ciliatum TaxID=27933 RepID=UPI0031F65C17